MTRPLQKPVITATNENFSSPGDPWDGYPTKVQPTGGIVTNGHEPLEEPASTHWNWQQHYIADWIHHLSDADLAQMLWQPEITQLSTALTGTMSNVVLYNVSGNLQYICTLTGATDYTYEVDLWGNVTSNATANPPDHLYHNEAVDQTWGIDASGSYTWNGTTWLGDTAFNNPRVPINNANPLLVHHKSSNLLVAQTSQGVETKIASPGNVWTYLAIHAPNDGYGINEHPVTGTLIASDVSGSLWRCAGTNSPATLGNWAQTLTLSGSPGLMICPFGLQSWIARGAGTNVYLSTDDGVTWSSLTTGLGALSEAILGVGDFLCALDTNFETNYYVSQDGGYTWRDSGCDSNDSVDPTVTNRRMDLTNGRICYCGRDSGNEYLIRTRPRTITTNQRNGSWDVT